MEDIFNNPPPELQQAYNELYLAIESDVTNFIEANITEEIITR